MVTILTTDIVNRQYGAVNSARQRGRLGNPLDEFRLRHSTPDAVSAKHEAITFFIRTLRDLSQIGQLTAQGLGDDIRLGRQTCLFFCQRSIAHQIRHHRVVGSTEYLLSMTELIDTAVAYMT